MNKNNNLHKISSFLQKTFNHDSANAQSVTGGERSETYSFDCKSSRFILRIHNGKSGFEKDQYVYDHFSTTVQIPQILQDTNHPLPSALIDSIIITLKSIHSVPISKNG